MQWPLLVQPLMRLPRAPASSFRITIYVDSTVLLITMYGDTHTCSTVALPRIVLPCRNFIITYYHIWQCIAPPRPPSHINDYLLSNNIRPPLPGLRSQPTGSFT